VTYLEMLNENKSINFYFLMFVCFVDVMSFMKVRNQIMHPFQNTIYCIYDA